MKNKDMNKSSTAMAVKVRGRGISYFFSFFIFAILSIGTAWSQDVPESGSSVNDQTEMPSMNPDDSPPSSDQEPTATSPGEAQSKPKHIDHQNMPAMDHSTMPHSSDGAQPDMKNMDHQNMPGMDHSTMSHSSDGAQPDMKNMDHQNMPGMDHSAMPHSSDGASHDMDTMSGMDHGSMAGMSHGTMQGGAAPADARDPHAFSAGYSLESGPYALPGPRQLRMADEHNFGSLMFDRLEAVRGSDQTTAVFDLQAWYGGDYDRTLLKAEGDYAKHHSEELSSEVLWEHAVSAYWNSQLGVRYDSGDEVDRYWLAFGIRGLAPYWFEIDVTGYIGPQGRTSINLEAEYELLLTQKLVLQPRIEANAYGKEDIDRGIGAGVSDVSIGLRIRYEIRREFAPYIGVNWSGTFGRTADYLKDAGLDSAEIKGVAGLRFWF